MSPRLRGAMATIAVVATMAAASTVVRVRDGRYLLPEPAERLLYLKSGRVARVLSLSFTALAADVYWMRAIQHYGGDRLSGRVTGRFELLYPMLDLTTTLDPRFVVAYRFGAIFLAGERPDQAIRLLEKGLAADPARWQYAHDIGFVHLWDYGDARTAAAWFDRAARMTNAPNWLQPLAAATLVGTDRDAARVSLRDLALNADQVWIQSAARRMLAQVDALDQIDQLQELAARYQSARQTAPSNWADLVRAGLLRGLPQDPAGTPYEWDRAAGRVTMSPKSPLFPLPVRLGHR